MPAQRAINLVHERSLGCRGWIAHAVGIYAFADDIEASGLLDAAVSNIIDYENLWVYLPDREDLGYIELTCYSYNTLPMTIQRLNGPDHIVMPVLNLLASFLRELEISHEIIVWDELGGAEHILSSFEAS